MVKLTEFEQHLLGDETHPALALALRIVVQTARILEAPHLIPVSSAHIDGCLYHGDSGVYFAEKLVALGGKVAVPSTLNVGGLDLIHPELVKTDDHHKTMARRQMKAYLDLGCQASWTCAPYQAGHRPMLGEDIAWGESNAVVFANSVLGARTNRYGDLLDICLALTGRAPYAGLHLFENRMATVIVDLSQLSDRLKASDIFYPVLGSWLGRNLGSAISVITGIDAPIPEDSLKALGAGAASTGAVGLFHIVGQTPEAPTLSAALGNKPAADTLIPSVDEFRTECNSLSHNNGDQLDCIALGSPHFSYRETETLLNILDGRTSRVPFYVCTNRFVLGLLEQKGLLEPLKSSGIELVVDTCVAVAPILKGSSGIMMTNSAKFSHYGPGNTGYQSVFGSLADCVKSAVEGKISRDEGLWQDQ